MGTRKRPRDGEGEDEGEGVEIEQVADGFSGSEKGKQKVEETECGICLVEQGEANRGKLNCCDHFFCFPCILEWSKVESKCPLCKQRFGTIFKPATAGVRRRVVRVPTRDQVYRPTEEELQELADPYDRTLCMVCCQPGDDGLLLLCDGCDAGAHTYCVGLGNAVPRGDWFCSNCTQVCEVGTTMLRGAGRQRQSRRAAGSRRHPRASRQRRRRTREESQEQEEESASAVQELIRSVVSASWRRRWERPATGRDVIPEGYEEQASSRAGEWGAMDELRDNVLSSAPSARTLSSQRLVQQRIQRIRQNWEALRSGTASFPEPNEKSTGEQAGASSSGNADVDKAWEMFEIARAMACDRQAGSTSGPSGAGRSSDSKQGDQTSTRKLPVCASRLRGASRNFAQQSCEPSQMQSVPENSAHKLPVCTSRVQRAGLEPSQTKPVIDKAVQADIERNLPKPVDDLSKANAARDDRSSKKLPISSSSRPTTTTQQNTQENLSEVERTQKGKHHKSYMIHDEESYARRKAAKEHVFNIVEEQLKPLYKNRRLGKDQYKSIARSATHELLQIEESDSEKLKSQAVVIVEKLLSSCK